jgi:hypothetical protein
MYYINYNKLQWKSWKICLHMCMKHLKQGTVILHVSLILSSVKLFLFMWCIVMYVCEFVCNLSCTRSNVLLKWNTLYLLTYIKTMITPQPLTSREPRWCRWSRRRVFDSTNVSWSLEYMSMLSVMFPWFLLQYMKHRNMHDDSILTKWFL